MLALTISLGQSAEGRSATSLSRKKLNLTKGSTFTLKVRGVSGKKNIIWKSSKKKVASVTKKGKVTARKKGTAVITAKIKARKFRCKVTVTAKKKHSAPSPTPTQKPSVTPRPSAAPTLAPTLAPTPTPSRRPSVAVNRSDVGSDAQTVRHTVAVSRSDAGPDDCSDAQTVHHTVAVNRSDAGSDDRSDKNARRLCDRGRRLSHTEFPAKRLPRRHVADQ